MKFQDFRFGVRTLLKAPGFSLVAILTLALGICGTAATFSVVDHVLLRPLPYPQPERVVDVTEARHGKNAAVSPPNFMDWHNENVTLESLAEYQEDNLTLSAGDRPERVDAAAVAPESSACWRPARCSAVRSPRTRRARGGESRRLELRALAAAVRLEPGHRRALDHARRRVVQRRRGDAPTVSISPMPFSCGCRSCSGRRT